MLINAINYRRTGNRIFVLIQFYSFNGNALFFATNSSSLSTRKNHVLSFCVCTFPNMFIAVINGVFVGGQVIVSRYTEYVVIKARRPLIGSRRQVRCFFFTIYSNERSEWFSILRSNSLKMHLPNRTHCRLMISPVYWN